MDFIQLVIEGYINPSSREFLDEYFERKFYFAQKEKHYKADEFFKGCLQVVQAMDESILNAYNESKSKLNLGIAFAKDGNLGYNDLEGKSIEEKWQETIENNTAELEGLKPEMFPAYLFGITKGRYTGNLYFSEVQFIRNAIERAQLSVELSSFSPEQKIIYFKELKPSIPFRELNNTIEIFCQYAKPIFKEIDSLKYLTFFFDKIPFHKIETTNDKAQILSSLNVIYTGLELRLKSDINKKLNEFQLGVSQIDKDQLKEVQVKIIEILGVMKKQAPAVDDGITFSAIYSGIYKRIQEKEKALPIDFQVLISYFNEAFIKELISSYQQLLETINKINDIKVTSFNNQIELENQSNKKISFQEYALAYILDHYANGTQIPTRLKEGGFDKKQIQAHGLMHYQLDGTKDSFYRAVLKVSRLDLNKENYLESISKRWLEAVKTLSKNWAKTEEYLISKKLIRD